MSRKSAELFDLGSYLDLFSEKLNSFRTFDDCTTECSVCLISDEEDRTFGSPQIVLKVVSDTSRLTHTRCGDYDLWLFDEIYVP